MKLAVLCRREGVAPVRCADGDAPGTRTPNLVIKSHLLYQLS